jgi:hypothetical protein
MQCYHYWQRQSVPCSSSVLFILILFRTLHLSHQLLGLGNCYLSFVLSFFQKWESMLVKGLFKNLVTVADTERRRLLTTERIVTLSKCFGLAVRSPRKLAPWIG